MIFVPIFSFFPSILLKNFGSEWDRLIILIITEYPRAFFVTLTSIGIVLVYYNYLHRRAISVGYPIAYHKVFASNFYCFHIFSSYILKLLAISVSPASLNAC